MPDFECRCQASIVDVSLMVRCFTVLIQQDRRDVDTAKQFARAAGFDRLIIHPVAASDGAGQSEYVSAYRSGETWSTWSFARHGKEIIAWSTLTGRDNGVFPSMREALRQVLTLPQS